MTLAGWQRGLHAPPGLDSTKTVKTIQTKPMARQARESGSNPYATLRPGWVLWSRWTVQC